MEEWFIFYINDDLGKQMSDNYAAKDHNHDTVYSKLDHTHTGYASSTHTHDDRYYTETEIDTKVTALQTSFQGGVDTLYNKCVSCGTTPTAKTPTAIATAIETIKNSGSVESLVSSSDMLLLETRNADDPNNSIPYNGNITINVNVKDIILCTQFSSARINSGAQYGGHSFQLISGATIFANNTHSPNAGSLFSVIMMKATATQIKVKEYHCQGNIAFMRLK